MAERLNRHASEILQTSFTTFYKFEKSLRWRARGYRARSLLQLFVDALNVGTSVGHVVAAVRLGQLQSGQRLVHALAGRLRGTRRVDKRMRERRVFLQIAPFRQRTERRKRPFAPDRCRRMTGDQLVHVFESGNGFVERGRELRRAAAVGSVDERRPFAREEIADGGNP